MTTMNYIDPAFALPVAAVLVVVYLLIRAHEHRQEHRS